MVKDNRHSAPGKNTDSGFDSLIRKQKDFYSSGKTKEIRFRRDQLKKLKNVINKNEEEFYNALKHDFNKSVFETYATEVGLVYKEIDFTEKRLSSWAKSKRVKSNLLNFPGRSYIHPEPYGSVLIIGTWNYPVYLTMMPLIGAIAAGNTVILKPAELSNNSSKIISKTIDESFNENFVTVIEGGVDTTRELLKQEFDYIFFSGSPAVGKIVMRAAAEHLTPVTLELGGKSPAIVDEDAKIDLAAKRITWGKFLNAGQTCIAPDYVLVHKNIKDELVSKIIKHIKKFYGEDPKNSPDFPRIIDEKHFDRLNNYLSDGNIIFGGRIDKEEKYIEPTLVDGVSWESSIMQDEIFGPILPLLTFENLDEIIRIINERHVPLSVYYFSENRKKQKRVIKDVEFGGGCINDTVLHITNPHLPFGGKGNSGIGKYHGKSSFETFSHKKSVIRKSTFIDIPLKYPPYDGKLKLLKKILK